MFSGSIYAGIGCATLNKILTGIDVSPMPSALFKRYEREIDPAIEMTAKESCQRAALTERKLALESEEKL